MVVGRDEDLLAAPGKSTGAAHQTAPLVFQGSSTVRTGSHQGWHLRRADLRMILYHLGHGVRAGEDHPAVLPDGRWASNAADLFNNGFYFHTAS